MALDPLNSSNFEHAAGVEGVNLLSGLFWYGEASLSQPIPISSYKVVNEVNQDVRHGERGREKIA